MYLCDLIIMCLGRPLEVAHNLTLRRRNRRVYERFELRAPAVVGAFGTRPKRVTARFGIVYVKNAFGVRQVDVCAGRQIDKIRINRGHVRKPPRPAGGKKAPPRGFEKAK